MRRKAPDAFFFIFSSWEKESLTISSPTFHHLPPPPPPPPPPVLVMSFWGVFGDGRWKKQKYFFPCAAYPPKIFQGDQQEKDDALCEAPSPFFLSPSALFQERGKCLSLLKKKREKDRVWAKENINLVACPISVCKDPFPPFFWRRGRGEGQLWRSGCFLLPFFAWIGKKKTTIPARVSAEARGKKIQSVCVCVEDGGWMESVFPIDV